MTTKTKKPKTRRGGRKPGSWLLLKQEELVAFRERNGISRTKLAATLGVSPTSVQNWEVGNAVPTRKSQQRLREIVDQGGAGEIARADAQIVPSMPVFGSHATGLYEAIGTIVGAFVARSTRVARPEVLSMIRDVKLALVS